MDYYDEGQPRSRSRRLGTFFLGLLLGVAIGIALCWYVFPDSAEQTVTQTQSATSDKSTQPTERPGQEDNVEAMTLSEMTDDLGDVPDSDFERKYLVYAIQLGNYTTAINNIGKDRAEREELRKFTEVMYETSDEVTKQLFEWQSAWGYTDH